tara:strand:- start:211 stop:810 length:600 start_codon:yes stop_codon:yes gene_type:complete
MVIIIDYKVGNVGSISNMIKYIGFDALISNDINKIKSASKIILPGVGSFDHGMKNLKNSNLIEVLNEKVLNDKIPILGICLGAQLLTKSSQEGNEIGLGYLEALTLKFNENNLKLPHMGWNYIDINKKSLLMVDLPEKSKFYFVHKYYMKGKKEDVLTTTEYGSSFHSSLEKDNIFAVQFHPEKSHKYGMQLMKNFMRL